MKHLRGFFMIIISDHERVSLNLLTTLEVSAIPSLELAIFPCHTQHIMTHRL